METSWEHHRNINQKQLGIYPLSSAPWRVAGLFLPK
jgi:hypothetical protein